MAAATDTVYGTCYPGNSPLILRRVRIDVGGVTTDVQQAHVTSITYKVWCRGVQVGATGTLTVASVVYDTLQTGTTWVAACGPAGGNFGFRLPGAYLPDAGKRYTVQATFVLTAGTSFDVEATVTTVSPKG